MIAQTIVNKLNFKNTKSIYSEKFMFGNGRIKVINKASNKAFEMLLKEILKN